MILLKSDAEIELELDQAGSAFISQPATGAA
jgi:hypothetical protein